MSAPSDHQSPMSSSDTISGSASPFTSKQIVSSKPRSSSVNSVGSNVSNQRSMSIVSLELPRNSIVSVEDMLLRRVCNGSTTSLTSLVPVTSPTDQKEHYTLSNRMHKSRCKATSAVFSDEDSESENSLSRFRWRRRSSEKSSTNFLSNLKRDFKFRYGTVGPPKTPTSRQLEDFVPSQLSFSSDITTSNSSLPNLIHTSPSLTDHLLTSINGLHSSLPVSNTSSSAGTFSLHSLNASTTAPHLKADSEMTLPLTSGKKVRTSSITQSMILKRRLLLSKDIQQELIASHGTSLVSPTSIPHLETRFPAINPPISAIELSHSLGRSEPSVTEVAPTILHPSQNEKHPHQSSQNISLLPVDHNLVNTQNKLIYELNRKWNKSFFETKSPEKKTHPVETGKSLTKTSRKRSRSALISSMESSRLM